MRTALSHAGPRVQAGLIAATGVASLLCLTAVECGSRWVMAAQISQTEAAHDSVARLNNVWRGVTLARQAEVEALAEGSDRSLVPFDTAIAGLRQAIAEFGGATEDAGAGASKLKSRVDAYADAFARTASGKDGDAAALGAAHAIEVALGRLDTATEASLLEPLRQMLWAWPMDAPAEAGVNEARLTYWAGIFRERVAAAAIPEATRTKLMTMLTDWRHAAAAAVDARKALTAGQTRLRGAARDLEASVEAANRIAVTSAGREDGALAALRDQTNRLTLATSAIGLLLVTLTGSVIGRKIARPVEDFARWLAVREPDAAVPCTGWPGDFGGIAAGLAALRDRRVRAERRAAAAEAQRVSLADLARDLLAEIADPSNHSGPDHPRPSLDTIAGDVKALTELAVLTTDEISRQIAIVRAATSIEQGREDKAA